MTQPNGDPLATEATLHSINYGMRHQELSHLGTPGWTLSRLLSHYQKWSVFMSNSHCQQVATFTLYFRTGIQTKEGGDSIIRELMPNYGSVILSSTPCLGTCLVWTESSLHSSSHDIPYGTQIPAEVLTSLATL